MKRMFTWLWLLTKRLYKKPTFLVILALIPALVLGYGLVARDGGGIMTIALAAHDNTDPLAAEIIDDLSQSHLITFVRTESPEEAKLLVNTGKADAAWIFADHLEEKICKFISSAAKQSVIEVVERQSTIPLMLAREKLSGTVFAHCSPYIYLNYVSREIPQMAHMSDEQLLEYYEKIKIEGRLFEFSTLDGTQDTERLENSSYLTSPVRGMLAVAVALCGLAGAMYAKQDERLGTFSWMPERKRVLAEFAGEAVCVTNAAVAVVIALALSGLTAGWLQETAAVVVFILAVCAFSMLVSRLCGSLRMLCMWTPVLLVVMLVVCPVFFNLGDLFELQLLFPPTYYINGAYGSQYLLWGVIYTAVCLALCAGIDKLRAMHLSSKLNH